MVKPNDVIVVNPNSAKVSSAGYVGNVSAILGIASIVLLRSIILTYTIMMQDNLNNQELPPRRGLYRY